MPPSRSCTPRRNPQLLQVTHDVNAYALGRRSQSLPLRHPIVADVLLDLISLDYTETLQAAAGFQAEKCLHDTIIDDVVPRPSM